jgi:hypothetical protein
MARIGYARGWIGSTQRLITQQVPSTPSILGQLHCNEAVVRQWDVVAATA